MKLMYIDESGDTAPISQKGKRFLVLTGSIIDDKDRVGIETDLRAIKGIHTAEQAPHGGTRFARPPAQQAARY